MGDLDQLKQEMVVDLLRDWITVYERAERMYDAYDDEMRGWVNDHGHRTESLVSVVAIMQPAVRVVCRALIEDALAQLSQDTRNVQGAVEQVIAQAKSGEEMGGAEDLALDVKVEELEAEVSRLRRRLTDHLAACPAAPRSQPIELLRREGG